VKSDVNVYGNSWPLVLSHAKACAVCGEKGCHVSKDNLSSLNEPHASLTILKTMVLTRVTDDDFTRPGDIELQNLDHLSQQVPTVSVPGANPGSKTAINTSVPPYTAPRPASPTWAGPNERLEGQGRQAVYLRAIRTVLQHLDEQGWKGESEQKPTNSQNDNTRAWLLAATQCVADTVSLHPTTPHLSRYSIPRDVSDHLAAFRANSRNTEVEKASGLILEELEEDRKREEQELRVKQARDAISMEEAGLLGYWS